MEKRDKYLDLPRELKKLWNMQVSIIPIVIGAFGTLTKGLLKGLEDLEVGGWVETIQATELLKTARILRRVLETWGDLLSLNLQWKTISLRWWQKLYWVIIIIIIIHDGGLITAIRNDTDNTMDNRMTKTRKQNGKENNSMGVLKDWSHTSKPGHD